MPRKKTTKEPVFSQTKAKKKAMWGGYVDCSLGAHERNGFVEWFVGHEKSLLALLEEAVGAGYTVSQIFDEANEAYVARMYAVSDVDGKGYMLTAFHGTMTEALGLLFYKHSELLMSSWSIGADDSYVKPEWG